jgi:hypothetical protein
MAGLFVIGDALAAANQGCCTPSFVNPQKPGSVLHWVARTVYRAGSVWGGISLREQQCWEGHPKDAMKECPKDVMKKKNAGY